MKKGTQQKIHCHQHENTASLQSRTTWLSTCEQAAAIRKHIVSEAQWKHNGSTSTKFQSKRKPRDTEYSNDVIVRATKWNEYDITKKHANPMRRCREQNQNGERGPLFQARAAARGSGSGSAPKHSTMLAGGVERMFVERVRQKMKCSKCHLYVLVRRLKNRILLILRHNKVW